MKSRKKSLFKLCSEFIKNHLIISRIRNGQDSFSIIYLVYFSHFSNIKKKSTLNLSNTANKIKNKLKLPIISWNRYWLMVLNLLIIKVRAHQQYLFLKYCWNFFLHIESSRTEQAMNLHNKKIIIQKQVDRFCQLEVRYNSKKY